MDLLFSEYTVQKKTICFSAYGPFLLHG